MLFKAVPIALLVLAGAAAGQTITVDTVEDVVDFPVPRTIDQLPGPDGRISMREATDAANNTPGPQTIGFAIPQSQWWLVNDLALLRLEGGPYLLTDDGTTIDGTTQTAFTGDTNPDGREVGIYGLEPNGWGSPAILIQANDCVVRGLGNVWQRGSSVSIWSGERNRIVGCVTEGVAIEPYPGTASFNVIGGTAPEDGNVIGEIDMTCGATDNVVIGNHIRSVGIRGSQYCQSPQRNRIGGRTPEERNVINGFGRYGEEGFPTGQGVLVEWAEGTIVEGNYIGVTADGMERVPQRGPGGVVVRDSVGTAVRGNLIAGIWVQGVNHYAGQVFGDAVFVGSINRNDTGTVVEGNLIGTDATGAGAILTRNGITVAPFTSRTQVLGTRIGGAAAGQGNRIAFTELRGVTVHSLVSEVEISGNSIEGNGELGIELDTTAAGFDGVTPNDPGDADTDGGNGLQNFPVLGAAAAGSGSVRVEGMLSSRPSRTYRLEFFANAACDPSGHGEGERFLGVHEVMTDAAGEAAFAATLAAAVAPGEFVTGTATDVVAGATSEFAACVAAVAGGCAADLDGSGSLTLGDFVAFRNLYVAGGPGADFDGNGSLTLNDFVSYRNAYVAGCP